MRRHQFSFQRIESDYAIGTIRSVEVDHDRRMLIVISDSLSPTPQEMSTVSNGGIFTIQDDR